LLINDQIRGLLYLYNVSGSVVSTFGGVGVAAAWTQDSNTLYVVDSAALGGIHTNTLYVHDTSSGWSTYDLSASGGARDLALTVPGLGAWLAGNPTVAHTWCPSGTVGNNATILFYPQPLTDSLNIPTSVLGATSDGQHIAAPALRSMISASIFRHRWLFRRLNVLKLHPARRRRSRRSPRTLCSTVRSI
jgi:trimeric autotransporter adhesin